MTLGTNDSSDTQFVDVVLSDHAEAPPAVPQSNTGSLSSYRRNASRWQSHVALHTTGSPAPAGITRRSSTPNLNFTTDKQSPDQSYDSMSQPDVAVRRVAGRYRRRSIKNFAISNASTPELHNCRSSMLEPTLSPGLTLTVADDDGELHIMRSPVTSTPVTKSHKEKAQESIGSPTTANTPDTSTDAGDEPRPRDTPTRPSRTRMPHLPPKSAAEEARHLETFRAMMHEAKLAEKRKEEKRELKRLKRLEWQMETRSVWDNEILPCWTRARTNPRYRELWWGGIPGVLRSRLWPRACGNALMLPHGIFARALDTANRMRDEHVFPTKVEKAIDRDIERTLPSVKLFQKETGALWGELKNVLLAYAAIRIDEASQLAQIETMQAREIDEKYRIYTPGTASLAAMLIMNSSPQAALLALFNLISSRGWLHTLYALEQNETNKRQMLAYERVFNTLLAEKLPIVYANMQRVGVHAGTYLREWICTLFVPWLDLDTVSRLWDIMCVRY